MLIIVKHHLIDEIGILNHRLFDTFRTVFFAIARYQQAFESSHNVQKTIVIHVSQIACMQPTVP